MKINKLAKTAIALIAVISMGGGYNLNEVYASGSTSTVSLEDYDTLSSYTGIGQYINGESANIEAEANNEYTLQGWFKRNLDNTYTRVSNTPRYIQNISDDTVLVPDVDYKITYDCGGKAEMSQETYRIGTSKTLSSPPPAAFIFDGWTGPNGSTPQKNVVIDQGTTAGNKKYTASWRAIYLTVTGANYIKSITSYAADKSVIQTVTRSTAQNIDTNMKIQVVPGGTVVFSHGDTALEWGCHCFNGSYSPSYYNYKSIYYKEYAIRIPEWANEDAVLYCYYHHYEGSINGDIFDVMNGKTTSWAAEMGANTYDAYRNYYHDYDSYWNLRQMTITGANYISEITVYSPKGSVIDNVKRNAPLNTDTDITIWVIPTLGGSGCKVRCHHSAALEWGVHYKDGTDNLKDVYTGYKSWYYNYYDFICKGGYSGASISVGTLHVYYAHYQGQINGDIFDPESNRSTVTSNFRIYVYSDGTLTGNDVWVIRQD